MYQDILYDVEDPIATITLNRPDRLNALTMRLLAELRHAVAAAEADPAVVAILITGAGRGFTPGMDMEALASAAGGGALGPGSLEALEADPGDPAMAEFDHFFGYIITVRKPILAAINGPCAGLGLAIASLCDLRFASDKAVFNTAFAARGLVAEHGAAWTLPRLLGTSRALDILWSARKFDATEAKELGLVDRVYPHEKLLDEARAYLRHLAATVSPTSIMVMKQQVYKSLQQTFEASQQDANRFMGESLQRPDFKEGVQSFLERRPPRFSRIGK